jgi:Fic family protein
VDLTMFENAPMGSLVPIQGTDPIAGPWEHHAFIPSPLSSFGPVPLQPQTYLEIANARAAIAALDSTARQLPDPTLLRRVTLQREAQSTSALEGTYVPLSEVLVSGDDAPPRSNRREVLNYVHTASYAFQQVQDRRPLTASLLCTLQEILVRGTKDEGSETGMVRKSQVAVGRRTNAPPGALPVHAARFIPSPAGPTLEANVQDLTDWIREDRAETMDPIVAAAMAHYQFETLHPFHDGNGRIGRLLIVLQLYMHGVLSEPTLTVSPWFEARRTEYYDRLLSLSCTGDWDSYIAFFARGIMESAKLTHREMMALVGVQESMKEEVRSSRLRADTALLLVDFAVANPSFTVRQAATALGVSYPRANKLVSQLQELGVLRETEFQMGNSRRFYAPKVLEVLVRQQ